MEFPLNWHVRCFSDPFLFFTDASVPEEARDAAIGYTTTNQLLFVVHVEVTDEGIRIISARRATSPERRQYEEER
ncbi:MAG TPA: BrnT family toxin [Candidatus Binatia bacterium]|nr:BrnT family toxin [Candidatus Binatia bacterium]